MNFNDNVNWLQHLSQPSLTFYHGLEKEGLRSESNGKLAQTPHPSGLGSALTHPKITTDYSEALLEFITPVHSNPRHLIESLTHLHQYSYQHLKDEVIWPASMPTVLQDDLSIPIADYGNSHSGQLKHVYRHGLWHRYGRKMQCIAGLHYNFSFSMEFWQAFSKQKANQGDLQEFISKEYFHLIRGFRRHSWLLLYLFGASPAVDKSFSQQQNNPLQSLSDDTDFLPFATSLRMSDIGYANNAQSNLNISYNNLEDYSRSLTLATQTNYAPYADLGLKDHNGYKQLNSNILQIENEYYSNIRPKRVAASGENPIEALRQRGVEYIEIRNIDLNPLMNVGIDESQIQFLDCFLLFCLLSEQNAITECEEQEIKENQQRIIYQGRAPNLSLLENNKSVSLQNKADRCFEKMSTIAKSIQHVHPEMLEVVTAEHKKIHQPQLTPSAQLLDKIQQQGSFVNTMLKQGQIFKQQFQSLPTDANMQKKFEHEVQQSLKAQRRLEEKDTGSFDDFVDQFFRSYSRV